MLIDMAERAWTRKGNVARWLLVDAVGIIAGYGLAMLRQKFSRWEIRGLYP
jgi:hypothetical protein